MLNKNPAMKKRAASKDALGLLFILISILLIYVKYISDLSISFALFYFFVIWLTVVYAGSPYSYLVALVTALGKSHAAHTGQPLSEFSVIADWQFISKLSTHILFCYLMSIYYQIDLFLKPRNNQLLQEEFISYPLRQFIFRPYVNRYWSLNKRLSMIANHYQLVKSHITFLNLPSDGSFELIKFNVGDELLRVVIDRPSWMRPEGEIGLSLFYGIDRIYTAMFLVSGTPEKLQIIIGNLQGDGRNRAELYKDLTKILYGIRPRDFLLDVLIMLGSVVGCEEILGVSDDAHRSSHWLSRAKKLCTYDEIWLEHGGIKDETGGFYHLPSRIQKRTTEEIPARKRALYRRRYQFLDDLQLKIRMRVSPADTKLLSQ